MIIEIRKTPQGYDSDDVRLGTSGFGYIGKKDKHLGLLRCPECGKENYALNVSSGICAWCGWDMNSLLDEIQKLYNQ